MLPEYIIESVFPTATGFFHCIFKSSRISYLNSFFTIFRDELLDQIRTGVTLKKVSADEQRQQPLPAEAGGGAGGGIAGMLQRALQERSGALRFSSSEDEGSETTADDDDEWD